MVRRCRKKMSPGKTLVLALNLFFLTLHHITCFIVICREKTSNTQLQLPGNREIGKHRLLSKHHTQSCNNIERLAGDMHETFHCNTIIIYIASSTKYSVPTYILFFFFNLGVEQSVKKYFYTNHKICVNLFKI